MTGTIRTIQAREPRYDIKRHEDLTVTVKGNNRSSGSDSGSDTLVLTNLSASGAKFKSSRLLAVDEVVLIEIHVQCVERSFSVAARMRWVAPAVDEGWWLGCSLKPSIPQSLLDQLAKAGVLERREYRRENVSVPAVARWELTGEAAVAQVLDFSRGGFCITMTTEGRPGDRVVVQLRPACGPETMIHGKALWLTKSGDGFKIGCEFLDQHDFAVLKELAKPQPITHAARPPTGGWRRRWAIILAATLLPLSVFICGVLMRSSPTDQRRSSVRDVSLSTTRTDEFGVETETRSDAIRPAERVRSVTSQPTALVHALDTGMVADSAHSEQAVGRLDVTDTVHWTSSLQAPRPTALHRRVAPAGLTRQKPDLKPTRERTALQDDRRSSTFVASRHSRFHLPARPHHHATSPSSHAKTPFPCQPAPEAVATLPPMSHGSKHEQAKEAFRQGRDYYSARQYEHANLALRTAIDAEPTNASFHYLLAMIQYQQGQIAQAQQSVRNAVELESRRPLDMWGQRMERYQGSVRVWLEETRLRALDELARP